MEGKRKTPMMTPYSPVYGASTEGKRKTPMMTGCGTPLFGLFRHEPCLWVGGRRLSKGFRPPGWKCQCARPIHIGRRAYSLSTGNGVQLQALGSTSCWRTPMRGDNAIDKRGKSGMKTSRLRVRPAPSPVHWSVQRFLPPPRSPLGWLLQLHREQAVSVCGGLFGGEMSERPCDGATLVWWNSGVSQGLGSVRTRSHYARQRG